MKTFVNKSPRFVERFDEKSGFYLRTSVLDANGRDTGEDPFMRDFPSLIDIGIMGSCIHGKSGLCIQSGVECYQNGLNVQKPNMSIEDYNSILDQCKDKVFQIALGGRGDFNKHENIGLILKHTRDAGIVPNGTTSGLAITDTEISLIKKYMGACAVSEYRSKYTRSAIARLVEAEVKTNVHYVISNSSLDEAIRKLRFDEFDRGVNAVIFLLHKNVGLGSQKNVIVPEDPRLIEFFALASLQHPYKIGFDSCSASGIVKHMKGIAPESIEPCESAKFSMYIDADSNAMPCSFCNQDKGWFVSLKENTLLDAWNSATFKRFRDIRHPACSTCGMNKLCMPCFAVDGISLCGRM